MGGLRIGARVAILPPVNVDFLQPTSIEEALDPLARHGDDAKVIGGGTAMALLLRNRLISPRVLVSLDRVVGLAGIASEDGSLRIDPLRELESLRYDELVFRGDFVYTRNYQKKGARPRSLLVERRLETCFEFCVSLF